MTLHGFSPSGYADGRWRHRRFLSGRHDSATGFRFCFYFRGCMLIRLPISPVTSASTELGIPYVTINGADPELSNPDFSADDASAVRQAFRHLLALGHTKLAWPRAPSALSLPATRRRHTWKAMRVFPMKSRVLSILCTPSQAGSSLPPNSWCRMHGDYLRLGYDGSSVVRQCRSMYLQVPRDISVVGFDDAPIAAFSDPP